MTKDKSKDKSKDESKSKTKTKKADNTAGIEKKYFVYVLQLRNDKYYVGKTTNAVSRITEHIKKLGSEWTRKYKPKKILKIYRNCSSFDEDKYTVMFMAIYGIDNVRGGTFCSINLSHSERLVLEKMIDGASDKCYKCGSTEHFAKDCSKGSDSDIQAQIAIIKEWCQNRMENGTEETYILLVERTNQKNVITAGGIEEEEIPNTKDRFTKRISRKHDAALFKYSVTSYDFHIKMLESENYDLLYNADGIAVLYHTNEEITPLDKKKMSKELEKNLATYETDAEPSNTRI